MAAFPGWQKSMFHQFIARVGLSSPGAGGLWYRTHEKLQVSCSWTKIVKYLKTDRGLIPAGEASGQSLLIHKHMQFRGKSVCSELEVSKRVVTGPLPWSIAEHDAIYKHLA